MPNPEQPSADPEQQGAFAARTAEAEALPLADRADAFSSLHDELRTRLESGGSASA
ncbi:hypothetical protein N8D74_03905 [Curtobacterium flaccumfaciens]|uniref:Uncharacterized protein n=1 Tax=Curtobacterium poinsettiae TaxID=159612 RepID=A0A9Q9P845_9MICO|nr:MULTISPECIES: hypothetical protein [Curtobacterium]MCS6562698.1 hypothetical protein [Curtobacterium flaccumfaciens pv. poinsettiae]MDT0231784.1 hypothetical protein [Curtobacterium sp. BRB10]UXN26037.1 hypothetical protein N8D74_03905 [Curtobacterium flaccumfaciens]UXN28738.1 hypothetical protein N8D75_17430 [Curtobacterium flaccumfaciens]UYC80879.1 hypothetical protein OE229_17490 [Curtobacterium flaccumfaciens pv. poinsettiae]